MIIGSYEAESFRINEHGLRERLGQHKQSINADSKEKLLRQIQRLERLFLVMPGSDKSFTLTLSIDDNESIVTFFDFKKATDFINSVDFTKIATSAPASASNNPLASRSMTEFLISSLLAPFKGTDDKKEEVIEAEPEPTSKPTNKTSSPKQKLR
jgi:hypothetical protein